MEQQTKPEYVLFIMKNCKYSKSFISKLQQKQELISKFNIVDVEELPSIPDEVNEVPCVYDGKSVYSGKESFKWLNEKLESFLLPADDCIKYSFVDGNQEEIFSNFSLLNQVNGSVGIGGGPTQSGGGVVNELKSNKTQSLESLMASRDNDIKNF